MLNAFFFKPEWDGESMPSHSNGVPADRHFAWLTMTNISPEDWCAAITERRKLIGRASQASIRISNAYRHVSRRHAEIWGDARGIHLADMGSLSGTHVNGVWIEKGRPVRISPGDRIWLGGVELRVASEVSPLARVIAEMGFELNSVDEATVETAINDTRPLAARSRLKQLSPAELEVVLWMCRGYVHDGELGKLLHRSPNTVRTQVGSILRKLGLGSRADVIAWLRRLDESLPE